MKALNTIKRILFTIIAIVYFSFALCMTILLLNYNKYGLTQFGNITLVKLTEQVSFEGYQKGDLVIVESMDVSTYEEGDVVFTYFIDQERKPHVKIGNVGEVYPDDNAITYENGDSYKVFTEYFNFGCYIASIAAICLFIVMPEFIDIWMKHQDLYQVTFVIAFLFAVNIFYMTMREPIIICRDANGLFKQAKNNAYLLAIVKVVLSMVLIQFWGITGVLLATLIAYWVVDFLYNPLLVYREVFKLSPWRYYKMTFSRLFIACVVGAVGFVFWNSHLAFISGGFVHFFIACMILGISVLIVITLIYVCSYESFRNLIRRIYQIFKRRMG